PGLKWVPDKLTFRLWLVANSSRSNGAPKTGSLVHFLSWVLGSVHRLVPEGIEFRSRRGNRPSGPPTDWLRACRSRSRFSRQARGGLRAVRARDGPEDGVREPCRRCAPADHLVGIVDPPGFAATASQRAEVDHRAAGPEECMRDAGRILAGPDDLPGVVDAIGVTCVSARKRAQVGHRAVLPEERVRCAAGIEAPSDHLAGVVNGLRFAVVIPGERPEVRHRAVVPDERMGFSGRIVANADDLARLVDPRGARGGASQGPDVRHDAVLPEEGTGPALAGADD